MKPLISVIIPIYNVEKYLNKCLDTIINQTYNNLEIILVDDGSPDNCSQICEEYAKKDKRIKIIHKQNGGLSDARNAGLEICKGEYIAFIDSDDWIDEKYIEELFSLINSSNSDIASCNYFETSNEKIKIQSKEEKIFEFSNIEALYKLSGEYYVQLVVAWGKIYKKELFDEIRFPVGKIHEDEFTTYKLLYKSKKVVLTTKQLYYYRQRPDSIMGAGFNIKGKLDIIEAYKERANFFENIGQKELSNMTNKILFWICLETLYKLNKFNYDLNYKQIVYQELKNLKYKLRTIKFTIKFKIFYELAYLMPLTMYKVYLIL